MRTYIMTDLERNFVEKYLETGEVAPEDYNTYCQLRHQFRNSQEVLTMDLATLEIFIDTTRRPKCFGSDDVVYKKQQPKGLPKNCLKCDVQAECLVDNCRQKVFS